METPEKRLQKWSPELVLASEDPGVVMMIDPEHYLISIPPSIRLRLIANRNLCRRALQKCCTIDNENI